MTEDLKVLKETKVKIKTKYTVRIVVDCKRPEEQGQRLATFDTFREAIAFQMETWDKKGIETYISKAQI